MQNLYDMVVESVESLAVGFSAYDVTQRVRRMAQIAQLANEDLDLPLSSDPGFKWNVSHSEVKRIMEQLYGGRAVDRTFNSSGYFVYHVVTATPAAATAPTTPTATPATTDTSLLDKLVNYINGYRSRSGVTPTAKEVQSRFKRESDMTCQEFINFAARNNVPVTLGATPSVSTIG
jgi:hypothetical protein